MNVQTFSSLGNSYILFYNHIENFKSKYEVMNNKVSNYGEKIGNMILYVRASEKNFVNKLQKHKNSYI